MSHAHAHGHVLYQVFKQIFVLAKQNPHWSNKSRKTGFVILLRKGKGVWGNKYMVQTLKKNLSLCTHQKHYTMSVWPNRASVLLNRVSVCSKQRLTLAKKDLCLYQTGPLFEPNRASVYVWFYYLYSLCGYVSTLFLSPI